jgi:probable H4MPT-linked C1 transfer pathway protein
VLGLDIGGANVKAAHSGGQARSVPFALWRRPTELPALLGTIIGSMPGADALAVTMTGELCDAFATRRDGVNAILDAVERAARVPVRVWRSDGRFADAAAARASPWQTASANWLALATFAGRFAPSGTALVIDAGSTTTDIIPLNAGRPCPVGLTDPERLGSGELVYTGVRRTPLCALLPDCAAELFATTLDVYLMLGDLPEDEHDCDTADGRPATCAFAHARLARTLLEDAESCPRANTHEVAALAHERQLQRITVAIKRVIGRLPAPPATLVLAGSGEFLARRAADHLNAAKIISLSKELGPDRSTAACAYAVAVLAGESS